jgi:nucleotide-binding universal stress UspA family protein
MERRGVHHLPVLAGGALAGMVTLRAIHALQPGDAPLSAREWRALLATARLDAWLDAGWCLAAPHERLGTVARAPAARALSAATVAVGRRPLGVITVGDLPAATPGGAVRRVWRGGIAALRGAGATVMLALRRRQHDATTARTIGAARRLSDSTSERRPVMRQILVPLDGSALAELALPHARMLARLLGAPLHLLRVVDDAEIERANVMMYQLASVYAAGDAIIAEQDALRDALAAQQAAAEAYLAARVAELTADGATSPRWCASVALPRRSSPRPAMITT